MASPIVPSTGAWGRARQRWLDLPVTWKGLVVIALPLAVLLPSMVNAVVIQQQITEARAVSRNANGIVAEVNSIVRLLVDAETAVRGFATTDDPALLEPFDPAVEELDFLIDELDSTRAESFSNTVPPFVEVSRSAVSQLERAEAAAASGVLDGDTLLSVMVAGGSLRDQARNDSEAILAEAADRVADQRSQIDQMESWLLGSLMVGIVVATIAGAGAMYLVTNGVAHRLRLAAENASRLARELPPEPAPPSRDEIGQLQDELVKASHLLEQRRVELVARRDEAVAATRAKDEFLSRMSHELRTPLTAVIGFSQLLELENLTSEDRESAEHITNAGRHLLALIDEILDISRIETGNMPVQLERVRVVEVTQEAIVLLGTSPAEREVTITSDCDSHVAVLADHQHLKQVLVNLLSNAVKYNRHGGSVVVGCTVEGASVRISVTDTGMGLSEASLRRIFTPFDRLEAADSGIQGTGVGLALSKGLTESMGGRLGIESTLGEGSTFWIDLPPAVQTPPVVPGSVSD